MTINLKCPCGAEFSYAAATDELPWRVALELGTWQKAHGPHREAIRSAHESTPWWRAYVG